jgi:hypothetical protein
MLPFKAAFWWGGNEMLLLNLMLQLLCRLLDRKKNNVSLMGFGKFCKVFSIAIASQIFGGGFFKAFSFVPISWAS